MTTSVEALFARELSEDLEDITEASTPANLSSWDSFNNVKLIIAIEDAYKVSLTSAEIEGMKSVAAIKAVLRKKGVAL